MKSSNRRAFFVDVGRGMLIGGVGAVVASDLGLASLAWASDDAPPLTFGPLERLVDLMQETAPDKLLPKLVSEIGAGTDLMKLTTAAALANARRFGGEDYVGFHTFMALAPAYAMSQQLPATLAPLPVLKVIHRNAQRIQEDGGPLPDHLAAVQPGLSPSAPARPECPARAVASAVIAAGRLPNRVNRWGVCTEPASVSMPVIRLMPGAMWRESPTTEMRLPVLSRARFTRRARLSA